MSKQKPLSDKEAAKVARSTYKCPPTETCRTCGRHLWDGWANTAELRCILDGGLVDTEGTCDAWEERK